MLSPSPAPPPEVWREVERELRRQGKCTQEAMPERMFCGRQAVTLTKRGPRCEEHLRPF